MDVVMHPDYATARRKLRDIRRHIKMPVSQANVIAWNEAWREAEAKHPDGRECVRFVEDLIEQNRPLRW